MWIYSKDGFFSVVETNKDNFTVRARCIQDIKKLLSHKTLSDKKYEIITGAGTDYEYRTVMKKEDLKNYINEMVMNINYDNFKNATCSEDNDRHDAYMDCWSAMLRFQRKIMSNFKKVKKNKRLCNNYFV